jgi:hypothetical protein
MSSNHVPKKNKIEISTIIAPKIAPKVGLSSQLQGKSLESSLALTDLNISTLNLIFNLINLIFQLLIFQLLCISAYFRFFEILLKI